MKRLFELGAAFTTAMLLCGLWQHRYSVCYVPSTQNMSGDSSFGQSHTLANVVIACVETRLCSLPEKNPRWRRDYAKKLKVRNYGAAINLHYAQKHNYEYLVFCYGNSSGLPDAWLKVAALEWLFHRAEKEEHPTYILLADSDAYIRAMDHKLDEWLLSHEVNFAKETWSILFAAETAVGPFDPAKDPNPHPDLGRNILNTGVGFGYVDPADKERIQRALYALQLWQNASCPENACTSFAQQHPWEQGCLQMLLYNHTGHTHAALQSAVHIAESHMNLWNGPWGLFVRHVWGGPGGKAMRDWAYDDMVLSYQIDVSSSLSRIKTSMVAPNISLKRHCN